MKGDNLAKYKQLNMFDHVNGSTVLVLRAFPVVDRWKQVEASRQTHLRQTNYQPLGRFHWL
eukprot:11815152-Alexandrium_andersonii.AAC.1